MCGIDGVASDGLTSHVMEQPPRERVAGNLRAILARRKMSGREFSDLMGWPVTNTARRLSGAQPMTIDELPEVARRLEISIADLLDGIEQSPETASA